MITKSFYNEASLGNEDCMRLGAELNTVLRPIFARYIEMGYSPREMTEIIANVSATLSAVHILRMQREFRKKNEGRG